MPIPASALVNIIPGVVSAGGASLQLNGLMLTTSIRVPIGTAGAPIVLSFPSLATVQAYFGAASAEAIQAAIYFGGFIGCTQFPSALLVAQYPQNSVVPYLRGGNVAGVALTTLQTFNGVLTVTVNGVIRTSANINLSSATSFSTAAVTIQAAFTGANGFDAVATATIASGTATSFNGQIVGNVLTVNNLVSGALVVGGVLSGTGGGGVPSSCIVLNQLTGAVAGSVGTYTVSTTQNVSTSLITQQYGILNISGVTSGTVAVGQSVSGTGLAATTISISSLASGTGGTGTYNLSGGSLSGTVGSQSFNLGALLVSYDSTSGAFVVTGGTPGNTGTITQASGAIATSLALTTVTGAVTSQGTGAASPSAFMTAITGQTTNWATFWTNFNPDAFGNAVKLAFAAWVNSVVVASARFAYAMWDTDITPTLSTAATSSAGYVLGPNGLNSTGTVPIYDPNLNGLAAFWCGMVASTNFNTINGRITHAYKGQTGLAIDVSSQAIAANLLANGYNFYGQYATANQTFNLWQNGSVTGPFQWSDSYVNQIWLNNALQLALMNFLAGINSVPYTQFGYAMLEAVIAGVAGSPTTPGSAVYNGVISVGVPLTAGQTVAVNTAAGAQANAAGGNPNVNVAAILTTRGWYAQILPASGPVRAARTSPPMIFWYTDGGSVQQISLASLEVQ